MATTAYPPPHLQVSAPDIMDTHSEGGLDFGDGDLELDLDSGMNHERTDDDVSIKDAVTDAGEDAQPATADQDDYMVDKEDVIEEDSIQYQDVAASENVQRDELDNMNSNSMLATDEDLIEYVDDEDQHISGSQGAPVVQDYDNSFDVHQGDVGDETSKVPTETDAYHWPSTNEYELHDHHAEDGYAFEYPIEEDETSHATNTKTKDHVDLRSDEQEGGIALETHDTEDHHDEENDSDDTDNEHSAVAFRPITVNYEGNELWLLKEHDSDDTGDWLVEDRKFVTSSLSDLLQAFRTTLGEDLAPETELGLRFDHLHSMELYEDNTACVAVSLERLVNLYFTLHAQDGNDTPDSFYMCLLSRPRFATLLADVAKHADEGNGYSGLMNAIAAGETHFPDTFSGHSTEHENTEYENDEEEEEEAHEDVEASKATQSPSDSELETQQEEYNPGKLENENAEDEDNSAALDDGQRTEHSPSGDGPSPTQSNANTPEVAEADKISLASKAQVQKQSEADEQELQGNQDTVEYSDDDEDAIQDSSTNAPTRTSSTVQGDEDAEDAHGIVPANDTEHANNADSNEHPSEQGQFEAEEVTLESYEDYDYSLDNTEGVYVHDATNQGNESTFEGFSNEEYTNLDYETLNYQDEGDYDNNVTYDGQDTSLMANAFDGTDENEEFNANTEWGIDQVNDAPDESLLTYEGEFIAHEEQEEDRAVEQSTVAVSEAIDPPEPTTFESEDTLQRLKRSIDDVGDDMVNAPDSPENKRPRV